ncbi:MAG: pyridine nucleotide-disulfide oxidoreductase [Desulfobacteraceae bacterium 4484_190.2]|nr:MAG: pyridine nucleotide-disulfide oxidoreductase [Desulfobacteraceae bacterium 4484_190.2]
MMEKTDVLVIGGSAAGIVAATTGKSFYPDKDFMVIRREKQVIVPCGIPYIFGSLDNSEQDMVPDAALTGKDVRLKIDEAVSLDQENKVCKTADGAEIGFEKLVVALGSSPVVPKWLKGADLENVFTIPKDKKKIDEIKAKIGDCNKVVAIGGGFIGVELADEINKLGKDVTIVEILPHILDLAFDKELAMKAEELLESRGIHIKAGHGVREILGDKKINGVLLNDGERLEADAAILAMGYHPNVGLAEKAGLKLNDLGFIGVDEYMRTSNLDIFAVGDCAEKRSFLTRTQRGIMLASTACAEARVAGMNLYKLSAVKTFGGTIAMFSTAIGDTGFGAAGVTEDLANERGFDYVTGTFEGVDKHPGTLPGTHQQIVKLIVARESGILIGGEVIGAASTGELINLIGFAIQNRMSVISVLTAQIGTHPLLTGPPTAYPLIKAAEIAAKKRSAA